MKSLLLQVNYGLMERSGVGMRGLAYIRGPNLLDGQASFTCLAFSKIIFLRLIYSLKYLIFLLQRLLHHQALGKLSFPVGSL
jgi:hypothetical protein